MAVALRIIPRLQLSIAAGIAGCLKSRQHAAGNTQLKLYGLSFQHEEEGA
jgi:hypothetical protein